MIRQRQSLVINPGEVVILRGVYGLRVVNRTGWTANAMLAITPFMASSRKDTIYQPLHEARWIVFGMVASQVTIACDSATPVTVDVTWSDDASAITSWSDLPVAPVTTGQLHAGRVVPGGIFKVDGTPAAILGSTDHGSGNGDIQAVVVEARAPITVFTYDSTALGFGTAVDYTGPVGSFRSALGARDLDVQYRNDMNASATITLQCAAVGGTLYRTITLGSVAAGADGLFAIGRGATVAGSVNGAFPMLAPPAIRVVVTHAATSGTHRLVVVGR